MAHCLIRGYSWLFAPIRVGTNSQLLRVDRRRPSLMQIRQAKIDDVDALVAFNQAISRETEDKELDAETLTRGVIRFLSQDHYGFYTVAEIDGEVAGSLMITYEWTDWRNGVIWWIQSVYVSAEHRRKGIYTALYENARLLAGDASDVRAIRLYMEKDNEVARQTYQKLGMQETYYRIFEAEYP